MTASVSAALDVLRCMALDPTIGGVLFLDLDPVMIRPLGSWLADAMVTAGAGSGQVVSLGAWHTDDDLWLGIGLAGDTVTSTPGLLTEEAGTPPPVVLVPNLAHTSLAVHRAAIALVGADVAVSERYGTPRAWTPRARWIAACERHDALALPAHLLDRFPVRCDGTVFDELAGEAELRLATGAERSLADVIGDLLEPVGSLPAKRPPVTFTTGALDLVVSTTCDSKGERRALALGRLARAVARRRGRTAVGPAEVEAAAALMGLEAAPSVPRTRAQDASPEPETTAEPVTSVSQDREWGPPRPVADVAPSAPAPVLVPSGTVLAEALFAPASEHNLYPEDDPDALGPPAPLRLPPSVRSRRRQADGVVLGSEPSRDLDDLAVVPTLLTALRYRHTRGAEPGRIPLLPSDLRRNRRRPGPATALILVLDHTCRRQWDPDAALAPYLRWAHEQNSAVSLVEFGHHDAANDLRASVYRARNLIDPRVATSLNRRPGRASPLAHAIDTAVAEAYRYGRRARTPIEEILVVVVTDGRGNVPLDASVTGAVRRPVAARGVTDAISAAARLRTIRGVRSVVLAPDVAAYPDLPRHLATGMGATVMQPGAGTTE